LFAEKHQHIVTLKPEERDDVIKQGAIPYDVSKQEVIAVQWLVNNSGAVFCMVSSIFYAVLSEDL
jgi:hypothetical protein